MACPSGQNKLTLQLRTVSIWIATNSCDELNQYSVINILGHPRHAPLLQHP